MPGDFSSVCCVAINTRPCPVGMIETIISGCYGDEPGGSDFGWEGPVCFSVIFDIFQPGGRTKKVAKIQTATPL